MSKEIKEDIDPTDNNGYFHGYQQWYWTTGKLWYRGKCIHGLEIGYLEWHDNKQTNFYIR